MARNVTLDLDMIAKILRRVPLLADKVPQLAPLAPWAELAAEGLSVVTGSDDEPLGEIPGLPAMGTPGKGRMTYLRQGRHFSDAEVAKAVNRTVAPRADESPAMAQVRGALDFAMGDGDPDATPTDAQLRKGFDSLVSSEALPPAVLDRLGDAVMFQLRKIRSSSAVE